MRFSHLEPKITKHFLDTVNAKHLSPRDIIAAWHNPAEVYPSGSHPGQWRITGNGVCIVGKPDEVSGLFIFITVYLDRVLTPPREDQTDEAARRYRDRWERGLGRG